MEKKIDNKNNKDFRMDNLYYPMNYHIGEEENVFNNPDKYDFANVLMIKDNEPAIVNMPKEAVKYFLVGYTGLPKRLFAYKKIDETIIEIPNTENLVLIYNKYKEEEFLQDKENLNIKPLIYIPEKNIKIYTCCIICRLNKDETFSSFKSEDFDKVKKYLTE